MSINNRLKEIRTKLGMNQAEFAAHFDLRQGHYSKYETGILDLSTDMIKILTQKLNINANWLLTGDGDMFRISPSISEEDSIPQDNLLYTIIKEVDTEIKRRKMILSGEKRIRLIVALYEVLSENGLENIIKIDDYLKTTVNTHLRLLAE